MEYLFLVGSVLLGALAYFGNINPIFRRMSWGGAIVLLLLAIVIYSGWKGINANNQFQDSTTNSLKDIKTQTTRIPPLLDLAYDVIPNPVMLTTKSKDTLLFRIAIACVTDEPAYNLKDYIFNVCDTGELFHQAKLNKIDAFDTGTIHNNKKNLFLEYSCSPEFYKVPNPTKAISYSCFIIRFKDRNGNPQPPFKKIFRSSYPIHIGKIEEISGQEYYRIDSYAEKNKLW